MAQELTIHLPEGRALPDKQYFRIGEVATLLGVETHVVRFWQQQFTQVRPERSDTGRLLFGRPAVAKLARIRTLLYEQGYTITGAKKALVTDGAVVKTEVKTLEHPQTTQKHAEMQKQVDRLQPELDHLQREIRALEARLAAAETSESAVRRQLAEQEAKRNAELQNADLELRNTEAELRAALGEVEALLTVWPA